jgi:glycerate-2-kinase
MARARALDLSALEALDDNDTAAFFEKVGDVVRTGYTGTNVNDLVVALAYA